MNTSAVIWSRISSVEQEKGYSLDAQERTLSALAERKGLRVVKIFRVTESAKRSDSRTKFKAMIEFIRENEVSHLVALEVSRLARNFDDSATIRGLIEREGLTLHLADGDKVYHKGSECGDIFMLSIQQAVAENDNRVRGKKSRQGMLEKSRQGWRPTAAPLGYRNVPSADDPTGRRRIVEVDKEKAPLVQRLFDLYAGGGYSITSVREEVSGLGLTTKKGSPLTDHLVEKILGNTFYFGEYSFAGEIHQGRHVPLITRELFNRVQDQKSANRTYRRPGTRLFFPYKSFLRCGFCHGKITAEQQSGRHGEDGDYVFYHCLNPKRVCPQKYHREEDIVHLIADALGDFTLPDFAEDEIRARLKSDHDRESAAEKAELIRLRNEQTRRKNHIEILYEDRMNKVIPVEDFQRRSEVERGELARIEKDIARLGVQNRQYQEEGSLILELLDGLKETFLSADGPGRVKVLGILLDRIILAGEDTRIIWKEPWDTLFNISRTIREETQEKVVRGFQTKGRWLEQVRTCLITG